MVFGDGFRVVVVVVVVDVDLVVVLIGIGVVFSVSYGICIDDEIGAMAGRMGARIVEDNT